MSKVIPLHMSNCLLSVLFLPIAGVSWTLLQVNVEEKTVFFIDPELSVQSCNSILVHLFLYLRSELRFHRGQEIETSPWADLRGKSVPQQSSFYSGLTICQVAYTMCSGKTPPPLPEFRLRVVRTISKLRDGR